MSDEHHNGSLDDDAAARMDALRILMPHLSPDAIMSMALRLFHGAATGALQVVPTSAMIALEHADAAGPRH